MANTKPLTADRVLELGTTALLGVAVWGTLWNLIYGKAVYRTIKPCSTGYHFSVSGVTTTDDCPTVPQVPWLLIVICAVIGIALGIASVVAEESARAQRARAGTTPAQLPQGPAPQTPAQRPPMHRPPAQQLPARAPNPPPPNGVSPAPAAGGKRFGFLADARLAGLLGVVGLVLTVVQLFK